MTVAVYPLDTKDWKENVTKNFWMEDHVAGLQMKCTLIKFSKPPATDPGTYSSVALIFH